MSEQLTFDRKKGFVALPVEVLDMDLTPGAFRTLVELCRMANADGFCWPSLDQLSQRLGRSRSAISGYIKELRAEGLIATNEQRTANGYNYRLKYEVTFWADWRASLRMKASPKTERSVRPVERLKESQNQIHKNQPVEGMDFEDIIRQWTRCFHNAPYGQITDPPCPELLRKTAALLAATPRPVGVISADIDRVLAELWRTLQLEGAPDLAGQAEHLASYGYSLQELQTLSTRLAELWPSHWRQVPTAPQFEILVKDASVASHSRRYALIKGFQSRWQMVEKTLRRRHPSCSVAAMMPV